MTPATSPEDDEITIYIKSLANLQMHLKSFPSWLSCGGGSPGMPLAEGGVFANLLSPKGGEIWQNISLVNGNTEQ